MTLEIVFYCYLFTLAVQLFYYFYYFTAIVSYKPKAQTDEHLAISVIVCAHNELGNLERLIPFLLEQNYHDYELIIVNDRSFDGTEEYLERCKKLSSKIKIVKAEENKSNMDAKKYALTLGIKAAQNEHLLFTDADCVPVNKNWILQMQSQFSSSNQIVLGISQYEKRRGFLNQIIQFETLFTTIQYISLALRGQPYMGIGRNLGYTKSLFLNNKGFHPYMFLTGGDDDLFINKLADKDNTKVIISHESQTISIPKTNFRDWQRQKLRHLFVSKYYKTSTKWILGTLNLSHLLIYILGITILFNEEYRNLVLLTFGIRWFMMMIIIGLIIKKLRYGIQSYKVVLFDVMYPFYYILMGIRLLRTKKIKWR